jgi:hypothetical protein
LKELALAQARYIAIIGSFRQFYEPVLDAWREFTRRGLVVTSPLGTAIVEEGIPFVRFESDAPDLDDAEVQTVAMHRIMRADATFVVAPGGYIGRTTCYEVGRLLQAGRPTYFSAQPLDLPVRVPSSHVITAGGLADLVTRGAIQPMFSTGSSRHDDWERRLAAGDYLPD